MKAVTVPSLLQLHEILFAYTSNEDYDMTREILVCIRDKEEYTLITGEHNSTYEFDETEWESISYTFKELTLLASDNTSSFSDELRKFILNHWK